MPEWHIWRSMIRRCTVTKCAAWENYGGRGITVCPEWLNDFDAFLGDMGRRPSAGHELDRRDNDLGYNRHNCRWVSRKINSRNRRSARMVTYKGSRMCLSEACELAGISYTVVQKRLDGPKKWNLVDALETPVRPKSRKGEGAKPRPMSNATNFPGVKRRRKGFIARCVVNGKRTYSKQFSKPEDAYIWYLKQKCKNLEMKQT